MRDRTRSTLALALGGVLLALAGCGGGTGPNGDDPAAESADFVVSYAGAASRLVESDPTENHAQLLDWARYGLASDLELDTARVRDAVYDAVPVRDGGFTDLSRQDTGPGRSLFDGKVLHLLVARDDPHRSRTVGQLLDQHRTDAGADPEQVRVHDLAVHPESRTIDVTAEQPASTDDVRAANGYVSARIDEVGGLTDFLARTRYLSTVEVRGTEVWAGGWNWPDGSSSLDMADVSALQRGYQAGRETPGFSLDPGTSDTAADLLASLPGLTPDFAGRVLSGDWSGTAFRSTQDVVDAVTAAMLGGDVRPAELGLPTTRESLWGLWVALRGDSPYSQARYDGGLAGTAVGMTLFYTDYVAKDWVNGTGTGVPAKAVEGFVSDPDAVTPWSQCEVGPTAGSGRLWFGQNESAFAYDAKKITMGAQSTRLFSRSDAAGGGEVEPSFSFGRGLRWWDQHYQAVADYEPQYQRLDQIMRWSGALEWLAAKTSVVLPQLPDARIPANLTFADWYAKNSALRERAPIRFVTPPSAKQEALVTNPSKNYERCGYQGIAGGVSLSDLVARKGGKDYRATLPGSVNRAGLLDEASTFDAVNGTGAIKQLSVDSKGGVVPGQEHAFRVVDGKAVVEVSAAGRKVVQLGGLKVMLPETVRRKLTSEIEAHDGHVTQRVAYEGHDVGQFTAERDADLVTITWRRGVVDRVRGVLDSAQKALAKVPGGVPSAKDGVLYTFQDPSGRVLNRVGGADDPWLSITDDLPRSGGDPVFRLGAPNADGIGPRFFYGVMVEHPAASEGRWIDVAPMTADRAAVTTFTNGPPDGAKSVPVTARDGRSAQAYLVDGHVMAPANDPILGINGLVAGAALMRDMPKVTAARAEAAKAGDGLWRGVGLGEDGVALVNDSEIRVVPGDDPWAAKVLRAIDPDQKRTALVRLKDDHAVVVDKSELIAAPGSHAEPMTYDQASRTPDAELYLHESFRASLSLEDGRIIAGAVPRDTKVTVRKATVVQRATAASILFADVRAGDGLGRGAEWLRITVPPRAVGDTDPSATPTPTAAPGGTPSSAARSILLICPDTTDTLVGCGN